MWPFKKKVKEPDFETIQEVIVDKILGSENYIIKVGIETWGDPAKDRWRVYFILRDSWKVYPRSHYLEKHRALKVAEAFTKALEMTYDMSLEQTVCDL